MSQARKGKGGGDDDVFVVFSWTSCGPQYANGDEFGAEGGEDEFGHDDVKATASATGRSVNLVCEWDRQQGSDTHKLLINLRSAGRRWILSTTTWGRGQRKRGRYDVGVP
jgi:hypothetical protein